MFQTTNQMLNQSYRCPTGPQLWFWVVLLDLLLNVCPHFLLNLYTPIKPHNSYI